ncbi:putative NT-type C2 domain, nucleoporin [Dioscorea sansibarensis]
MVLGLRSKNRKGTSVQVDYIIQLQQIKPWPPSNSLRSLRSVVLQWENGDKSSGFTNPVTPSLGEGKIEFNETFKLQVSFLKESSPRGNDSFQKNVLELNLYEPRRDKSMKGQHLGGAAVDLAEHGILKETVSVGVPVSCKRSFRNTAQPILYLKIQPFEKDSLSSSSRDSLSKELSLDKDGRESVSALMNEEYAEEAEIASFTDDDISSHSSLNISSSTFEANVDVSIQNSLDEQQVHEVNASKAVEKTSPNDGATVSSSESRSAPKDSEALAADSAHSSHSVDQNGRLLESSLENLSTDPVIPENDNSSSSSDTQCISIGLVNPGPSISLSCSSIEEADGANNIEEVPDKEIVSKSEDDFVTSTINEEISSGEMINSVESPEIEIQVEKQALVPSAEPVNIDMNQDGANEASSHHSANDISVLESKQIETPLEEKIEEHFAGIPSDDLSIASPANVEHTPDSQNQDKQDNGSDKMSDSETASSFPRIVGERDYSTLRSKNRLKTMKFSVRSLPDTQQNTMSANNDQYVEHIKEIDVQENVRDDSLNFVIGDGKGDKKSANGNSDKVDYNGNGASDDKVRELEHKVEMLERELREAAAIEISVYSVVAEHGVSPHKVHTPARRLSRLYIHASRKWSRERRANAAKCAVSGLVLAAKSCGNDVPRLTFWLSNSVMLRAIIVQEFRNEDLLDSANGSNRVHKKKSSLRWESTSWKNEKFPVAREVDEWEVPSTFTSALERIEAWIFSRIIESIWWQTLTPHMQLQTECSKQKLGSSMKNYRKQSSLGDQQQANMSIEIWKKAFADACERLCPVRAAGHECGCLPMLAKLVMEQCVSRLDVAMFNAILRESEDEIPTDPVSDPISDSKVLPVPSGKLSFGAGAQLKNAIGNWSRWLTDLFGMDMDDSPVDENEQDDDRLDVAASLKSFHLLNALSDLLMLPKDMLLESSIRKEVCPTFSASMIKQILDNFLPDEFCPDPIPDMVFESLDSEDPLETSDEGINSFPCDASPVIYCPPSAALVQSIVGDPRSFSLSRSGSSVVRKCHTSDDELEELESPLTSIIIENASITKSKEHRGPSAVRYQLLHEVWRDGEH